MAEKKMILKIKIDESTTLKQLGMANQFKSIVVTQHTSCQDLTTNLLKVMSKGLTAEQKSSLEADVAEFQIADKVDGKIVRRYEFNEFPFTGMEVAPPTFIFAKPKKDKHKLVLKNKSASNTVKLREGKSSKRKSVFGQKPFEKMGDLGGAARYSVSGPMSPFNLHSSGGFAMDRESKRGVSEQPMRTSVPSMPQSLDVTLRPDQEILMDLVMKCYKGMGIPEHKIQILEQQTKEVASLHEFFDPPLVRKTLEDVQESLEPGFAKLADLRIHFFTQKCLRGYICRKRYARFKRDFLPSVPGGPSPPLGVRLHYIKEMIKSETAFRDRLYFTFNKVERQLKDVAEGSDAWLSKDDWKMMFSDSATFRTFFGRQLKKFEKVYSCDWPDLDWGEICSSFVKDFEDNGPKFHALSIKHQEIVNVIERTVSRSEFQSFFAQVSSDRKAYQYLQGNNFGLDGLIFDPLNRVAHYEGVLKRILGLTSRSRREYWVIEESLGKLTKMLAKFEEEKLQSKENVRLNQVKTKFGSVAGLDRNVFSFLPSDERGFVFQSELTLLVHEKEKDKWKGHDVSFMVFTDVIVISAESKGCLVMEENGCMLMCQVSVQESFEVSDPKYPSEIVFKIISEPKKDTKYEMVLACKTLSEKSLLTSRLVPLVKENRLCFSRPMQDVVDECGTELPNIVTTVLHSLRVKNAQQLEGIFRIAGEYKYLTQMKAQFDRWHPEGDSVQLDKYDSFDIASLLKQWFRELPEPVLTYAVYDKYVAMDDEVNYEEFIEDIPPLNRKVILAVMGFNVELTKFSDKNFMTPANIAICWGPTILRPLKDDMNSSMRIPRVNQIVEGFVKWCALHPDYIPVIRPPRKSPRPALPKAGSRDTLRPEHTPSFASCRPCSGTSTMIRMGSGGARKSRGPGLRAFSMISERTSPQGDPNSPPPSSYSQPSPSSPAAPPLKAPSVAVSSPSFSPTPTLLLPTFASSPGPPSARGTSSTSGRGPLPPPIAALPPPVGGPGGPGGTLKPPNFVPPIAPPILPPTPSCPASLSARGNEGPE